MSSHLKIVGLGEALFDVFPEGPVLGGAPLNVAVMADQLLARVDGSGIPISRIGKDSLGQRIRRELAERGITTQFLQQDDSHPTGQVLVEIVNGEPRYEIVTGVAWDYLEWTDDWRQLAEECSAVCYGTLAQRSAASRETILNFIAQAPQAIRLFDVNLRQSFYSADLIRRSAEAASLIKLNEHELPTVSELLGFPVQGNPAENIQRLRDTFGLEAVILTQGARGTALHTAAGVFTGKPVRYEFHPQADTVGAGDACTAGLLTALLLSWTPERSVELANHMGAFVASRPGATPTLPESILSMLSAD